MTWRQIEGTVSALAGERLSERKVKEVLTEHRIIASTLAAGDEMELRLAATGLRGRVAVLSDAGEIAPGPTKADVAELLAREIGQVRVHISDHEQWGHPDLGGIEDGTVADLAHLAQPITVSSPSAHSSDDAATPAGDGAADADSERRPGELSDPDLVQAAASGPRPGAHPDTRDLGEPALDSDGCADPGTDPGIHDSCDSDDGDDSLEDTGWVPVDPTLVLTDMARAAIPAEALGKSAPLTVVPRNNVTAVISDDAFRLSWSVYSRPTFQLYIHSLTTDMPRLTLYTSEKHAINWDFDGDFEPLDWVKENPQTLSFVAAELGAGGLASRIVTFLPHIDVVALRRALETHGQAGADLTISALAMNTEIADVLRGKTSAEEIAGGIIYNNQGLRQALKTSARLEVQGEGAIPGYWDFYRKIQVEKPWIGRSIQGVEAGLGALLIAVAASASHKDTFPRLRRVCGVLGGFFLFDAGLEALFARWFTATRGDVPRGDHGGAHGGAAGNVGGDAASSSDN